MEIKQIDEETMKLVNEAGQHVDKILSIMGGFKQTYASNQVLLKLEEAMFWFNQSVIRSQIVENEEKK